MSPVKVVVKKKKNFYFGFLFDKNHFLVKWVVESELIYWECGTEWSLRIKRNTMKRWSWRRVTTRRWATRERLVLKWQLQVSEAKAESQPQLKHSRGSPGTESAWKTTPLGSEATLSTAAVSFLRQEPKALLTLSNALPATVTGTSTERSPIPVGLGLQTLIASSLTTHHLNSLRTIGPQLGISTWLRTIGLWLCRRRPEVEGVIAGKTRRTCRIQAVAVEVGHRRRRGSEQSSRRSRRRRCWFWRRGLGGGFRSKTNRWSSSSATRLVWSVTCSRFGCITTSTPWVRNPS